MLTLKVTVWGIISAGILKQDNWPEIIDINNQQREVLYWGILIKDFTQRLLHHVFSNYDINLYFTHGQSPLECFTSDTPHSLTENFQRWCLACICVCVLRRR